MESVDELASPDDFSIDDEGGFDGGAAEVNADGGHWGKGERGGNSKFEI
jgi:hypothetical protein